MRWYSIEGTLGAGKSTMCQKLCERLPELSITEEPVHKWVDVGILNAFYNDPKRYAYTFQTFTFVTRLQEVTSHADSSELRIVERSVFSDRYVFAETLHRSGAISDMEWKMYEQLWTWATNESMQHIGAPAGFIYLRASPAVAHARMRKRSRGEEAFVALEYIEDNVRAHDVWLARENTLVIDVDEDFEDNPLRFDEIVRQIVAFISA
jgi:deoxyguanosine kinase